MHTTPLRRPRRQSTGPGRVPPSHEEIPVTRRKTAAHANHERWLVSYADFMTLLFAFFVVMFASTQNDKYKAKDVSDSVRQALEHGQLSAAISTVLGRGKHGTSAGRIPATGTQFFMPPASGGETISSSVSLCSRKNCAVASCGIVP